MSQKAWAMASTSSSPFTPRSDATSGRALLSRSPSMPPSINTCSHVQPERPELARHALRDHPQAGFRGGEVCEAGFAAQARRRAREDHRPPAERRETPGCFPAGEKAAEGTGAQEGFEVGRAEFAEVGPLVVADVIDDE